MEAERKENRFFRILQNSFWKLTWLNLLYLVCCLPIFTVWPPPSQPLINVTQISIANGITAAVKTSVFANLLKRNLIIRLLSQN